MSRSLVLASASPRRKALLAAAGYQFSVCPADVSEVSSNALTLREITLGNAVRKGRAVASLHAEAVIMAVDTLVALGAEVIGKPADMVAAEKILRRLNGRVHEVCSAVFLFQPARGHQRSFHEISRVHFRRLTNRQIHDYLERIDPLDKAGAYAAQEAGSEIISRIDGSFTNVVGLPMERTEIALRKFGVEPFSPNESGMLPVFLAASGAKRGRETRQ